MKQYQSNKSTTYTTNDYSSAKFTEDEVIAIRENERKKVVDVLCEESWFFDEDDHEENLRQKLELEYEEKLDNYRQKMYEDMEKEYEQKFEILSQKLKDNMQNQLDNNQMGVKEDMWGKFLEYCDSDVKNNDEFQNSLLPMSMFYFMSKKCN